MTIVAPLVDVSPLRQRLIDEMDIRRFGPETFALIGLPERRLLSNCVGCAARHLRVRSPSCSWARHF